MDSVLFSSKGRIVQRLLRALSSPPATGSKRGVIEESRLAPTNGGNRGEGRGTGPERAYDDSSRRSPPPLLHSFPNERALSPLPSPLPVAPLCFLNEQRTSDQLYRDLLFSERVVILGERVVKQLSGTVVVPLIERGHFLESNFIRTIETIEIQKGTEWKYRDFYF